MQLTWEPFRRYGNLYILLLEPAYTTRIPHLSFTGETSWPRKLRSPPTARTAKLSTGPRTEEGKSRTKYNAVTHGFYATIAVLPGERQEQWHSFLAAYVLDKAPAGLPQILCVEQAALAEWKLKRMNDIERKSCEEQGPEELLAELQGEYTYLDDMWKKQVQRIENHLIRVRDKHLAQLRLHKKDKSDAAKEANKPAASCQPGVSCGNDPGCRAARPGIERDFAHRRTAAEAAVEDAAELARWRQIREETAKFIAFLDSRKTGLAPSEISQEIENHLNEIGLPYPPEPKSN